MAKLQLFSVRISPEECEIIRELIEEKIIKCKKKESYKYVELNNKFKDANNKFKTNKELKKLLKQERK